MGNIYHNKISFNQVGGETPQQYCLPEKHRHAGLVSLTDAHVHTAPDEIRPRSLFYSWHDAPDKKITTGTRQREAGDLPNIHTCKGISDQGDIHNEAIAALPATIQNIGSFLLPPSPPEAIVTHRTQTYDGAEITIPDVNIDSWNHHDSTNVAVGVFIAHWHNHPVRAFIDTTPKTVHTAIWSGASEPASSSPSPSQSQPQSQSQCPSQTEPKISSATKPASDTTTEAQTNTVSPSEQARYAATMAPNFWPLWIAQRDILLRQCLRLMSGNMDDAQDALSEAMIKASVKFEDSMDEIRNHRAWLSRIVHNACIDLHRQNRRKADYNEETHSKEDNVLPGISRQEEATPEQNALTGETFSNLERALTDLPEKLRRPLLMRCVQDQSYDEIAENLGLSNCAVRKRVQLARDHLKGFDIR